MSYHRIVRLQGQGTGLMFNPTRDQVRRFFFDTWAKYQARQALEGAESLAIEIILAHPEYHGLLERPE
ncbi:MAG: DUF1841 family protein, partial [Thiobacillaceae bacterium]